MGVGELGNDEKRVGGKRGGDEGRRAIRKSVRNEGRLTKRLTFPLLSHRHLSFWKSSYPKSRPCAKDPPHGRVCNHNKMHRISVVFGSEEGRKGRE